MERPFRPTERQEGMNLEEMLPILIVLIYLAFVILERIVPAAEQPKVRRWGLIGAIFFVCAFVINGAGPALLMAALGGFTVLDLSGLGTVGGALVVLLATDLVGYWVHRGLHTSPFLWRWTHQLHHSAERFDMMGASFFHPFDFVVQNVLTPVAILTFLGVTPMAAAVGGLVGFVLGVSPHLNVKTPRWLGYLIQRPEMHAVHHQRELHAYNYGVLALSDLLFGTWRNPESFPTTGYGFYEGSTSKLGAMLRGRDIQAAG